jgi:uncharacterized protein YbaR (Trm112 family)
LIPQSSTKNNTLVNIHLLQILRCPQDHSELTLADESLVARINERIAIGTLTTVGGQTVKKPIDGGLVRAAGDLVYPVVGGIPVMLADEAIDITGLVSR